jgi:hypothetical protein
MSKSHDGYHHLAMVILVAFVLVLGCAAVAVGVNVIPSWVEKHQVVSK